MEMKEMVYSGNGKSELLYTENHDGYGLTVINVRGSHPCGYIQFPGIEEVKHYDDLCFADEHVYPHGGFTYYGSLENMGLDGLWLGWDYAHLFDYCCYGESWAPCPGDRKYTTEQIVKEAKKLLKAIVDGEYTIEHVYEEEEEDEDEE